MTNAWTWGELRSGGDESALEILKVGGSLLTVPGWPALLAGLVRRCSAGRRVLLVVGGGAIVDGLRAIDAAALLAEATTHGLAIDLLGSTARLVADAVALPLVLGPGAPRAAVIDVPRWLAGPGRLSRLPVGWHVTTDSIAALVATELSGDLRLAKRVAPPPCPDTDRLAALARTGWIDGHFPAAAAGLARIAWAAPISVPAPGVGGTAFEGGGAGGR